MYLNLLQDKLFLKMSLSKDKFYLPVIFLSFGQNMFETKKIMFKDKLYLNIDVRLLQK